MVWALHVNTGSLVNVNFLGSSLMRYGTGFSIVGVHNGGWIFGWSGPGLLLWLAAWSHHGLVFWALRYMTDRIVNVSGKGSVVALAIGFITAQRSSPWLSARNLMPRVGT